MLFSSFIRAWARANDVDGYPYLGVVVSNGEPVERQLGGKLLSVHILTFGR